MSLNQKIVYTIALGLHFVPGVEPALRLCTGLYESRSDETITQNPSVYIHNVNVYTTLMYTQRRCITSRGSLTIYTTPTGNVSKQQKSTSTRNNVKRERHYLTGNVTT